MNFQMTVESIILSISFILVLILLSIYDITHDIRYLDM